MRRKRMALAIAIAIAFPFSLSAYAQTGDPAAALELLPAAGGHSH